MFHLDQKLKRIKDKVQGWNIVFFINIFHTKCFILSSLTNIQSKIENGDVDAYTSKRERELRVESFKVAKKEDFFSKKKS